MKVVQWIIANWDSIIAVVVIILGIIAAIRGGEKKKINAFLLELLTNAEKTFGGGTSELKKSAVVSEVYDKLPSWAKMLFTETQLSDIIEDALKSAKVKWEQNKQIQEYIEIK